jgi:phenylalanine-4-hydroxylase
MTQDYAAYTPEDHGTWNILYTRQVAALQGKAYPGFLACLNELKPEMGDEEVADFRKVIPRLTAANQWAIQVVKGLIPVEEFFQLLAERKFSCSTWLRGRAQLDYLEEPDMFHDTFGHLALLLDPTYARFMEDFGKLGIRYTHDPVAMTAMQRLYWFTIEFGLIRGADKSEIYGAGILSSFGETHHIYGPDIEILDFDLEAVINNPFINSEIQMRYYVIRDFEQLYDALSDLEKRLTAGLDIIPAVVR